VGVVLGVGVRENVCGGGDGDGERLRLALGENDE
jgi:hypothetical protein